MVPCGAPTDGREAEPAHRWRARSRPRGNWELGAGNWFGRNDRRTQFDPVRPSSTQFTTHVSRLMPQCFMPSRLTPHTSCLTPRADEGPHDLVLVGRRQVYGVEPFSAGPVPCSWQRQRRSHPGERCNAVAGCGKGIPRWDGERNVQGGESQAQDVRCQGERCQGDPGSATPRPSISAGPSMRVLARVQVQVQVQV